MILFFDIPTRVNTNASPPLESTDDPGARASVSYSLSTNFANWRPFVMHLNMGTTNDCKAYIDKLEYFGTTYSPGKLVISANSTGLYGNTNYVLDGIRHHGNYTNGVLQISSTFPSFASDGYVVSSVISGLTNAGVATNSILFFDGLDTYTNGIPPPFAHPGPQTNIAGYMCWGAHSTLGGEYPTDGKVVWIGTNRWWIIETVESFNGQRASSSGTFIKWFSSGAFGGTNYSCTPVGAVTHVEEPSLAGVNNASKYFGLWASGKNFAICAWNSLNVVSDRPTPFQAVGDPFLTR